MKDRNQTETLEIDNETLRVNGNKKDERSDYPNRFPTEIDEERWSRSINVELRATVKGKSIILGKIFEWGEMKRVGS